MILRSFAFFFFVIPGEYSFSSFVSFILLCLPLPYASFLFMFTFDFICLGTVNKSLENEFYGEWFSLILLKASEVILAVKEKLSKLLG